MEKFIDAFFNGLDSPKVRVAIIAFSLCALVYFLGVAYLGCGNII